MGLYEYRDIWAEEGGAVTANSAEWSFGNGDTGFIGLPIDQGWEVEALYFNADAFAPNGAVRVDLMDYGASPSNAVSNTIATISLNSPTDGGGAANNAFKYKAVDPPEPIPVTGDATVLGFITRVSFGTISEARVGARLRRKVGEYVSDVLVS